MMIIDRGEEALPDDAVIVVHGGAGRSEDIVRAALRNYHEYRGFRGQDGAFTISVFAATEGWTVERITGVLPQPRFAIAKAGAVRRRLGFSIWPTTIVDPHLSPEMRAMQQVHFDLVLPCQVAVPPGTRFERVEDPDLVVAVRVELEAALVPFRRLFRPRRMKKR